MAAFALLLASYFGFRDSTGAFGLLVTDPGKLLPSSSGIPSGSTSTSFGAAQSWATPGTLVSQRFKLQAAFPVTLGGSVRVRAQWQILNTATAGAPTGRLNYRWEKNGGAIAGASTVNGATFALNAADNTQYTDIITVPVPVGTQLNPGDTLDLVIGFEVVVGAATSTGQVRLNHDPATGAQRLIVEFDQNP